MADWKEVLEHQTIKKLIEHLHLTNEIYVQNINKKMENKRDNLAIILKDGNNDR